MIVFSDSKKHSDRLGEDGEFSSLKDSLLLAERVFRGRKICFSYQFFLHNVYWPQKGFSFFSWVIIIIIIIHIFNLFLQSIFFLSLEIYGISNHFFFTWNDVILFFVDKENVKNLEGKNVTKNGNLNSIKMLGILLLTHFKELWPIECGTDFYFLSSCPRAARKRVDKD